MNHYQISNDSIFFYHDDIWGLRIYMTIPVDHGNLTKPLLVNTDEKHATCIILQTFIQWQSTLMDKKFINVHRWHSLLNIKHTESVVKTRSVWLLVKGKPRLKNYRKKYIILQGDQKKNWGWLQRLIPVSYQTQSVTVFNNKLRNTTMAFCLSIGKCQLAHVDRYVS